MYFDRPTKISPTQSFLALIEVLGGGGVKFSVNSIYNDACEEILHNIENRALDNKKEDVTYRRIPWEPSTILKLVTLTILTPRVISTKN